LEEDDDTVDDVASLLEYVFEDDAYADWELDVDDGKEDEYDELWAAAVDETAAELEEDAGNEEEPAALELDELQSVALTVIYSVTGTELTYEV
jgi:hypothetical protein